MHRKKLGEGRIRAAFRHVRLNSFAINQRFQNTALLSVIGDGAWSTVTGCVSGKTEGLGHEQR